MLLRVRRQGRKRTRQRSHRCKHTQGLRASRQITKTLIWCQSAHINQADDMCSPGGDRARKGLYGAPDRPRRLGSRDELGTSLPGTRTRGTDDVQTRRQPQTLQAAIPKNGKPHPRHEPTQSTAGRNETLTHDMPRTAHRVAHTVRRTDHGQHAATRLQTLPPTSMQQMHRLHKSPRPNVGFSLPTRTPRPHKRGVLNHDIPR